MADRLAWLESGTPMPTCLPRRWPDGRVVAVVEQHLYDWQVAGRLIKARVWQRADHPDTARC